jgi:hypothetical protein
LRCAGGGFKRGNRFDTSEICVLQCDTVASTQLFIYAISRRHQTHDSFSTNSIRLDPDERSPVRQRLPRNGVNQFNPERHGQPCRRSWWRRRRSNGEFAYRIGFAD